MKLIIFIKARQKSWQNKQTSISKYGEGKILTAVETVTEKWRSYFEEVLNLETDFLQPAHPIFH